MKNFLKKILLIIIMLLLMYLIVFYTLKYVFYNSVSSSNAIVLGDSHTEHLEIPNTFNYSFPGAPYIIHYNFVQVFKESIKGKVVFISFSPNNISNYKSYRFENPNFRPDWLSMVNNKLNSFNLISNKYYTQYSWYDNTLNRFDSNKFSSLLIQNKNNTSTIYEFQDQKLDAVILKHYSNELFTDPDAYELKYLKKTIEILNQLDCKIVLINTLKSKEYNSNIPLKYIVKYDSVKNILENKYSKLEYLNINNLPSIEYDVSLLKDPDHTNTAGDSVTSDYLLTYIK